MRYLYFHADYFQLCFLCKGDLQIFATEKMMEIVISKDDIFLIVAQFEV